MTKRRSAASLEPTLERSTMVMEHKMWRGRAVPLGGGAALGAVVGAAIGALSGPGAAVGAFLGASVGAAAGATMRRSEKHAAARDAELDHEIGVSGGDIGVPSLRHPPEGSVHPQAPASTEERAEACALEDSFDLEDIDTPIMDRPAFPPAGPSPR